VYSLEVVADVPLWVISTKEALQRRAEMRKLIREANELLKELDKLPKWLPLAGRVTGAPARITFALGVRSWAFGLAAALRFTRG